MFELKLGKETYAEGEPIALSVKIQNLSSTSVEFTQYSDLYVLDEKDKRMQNGIAPSVLNNSLNIRQTREILVNVNDRFAPGSRGGYHFLRAGTYRIFIKLNPTNIYSQTLTLKVRHRTQLEDSLFQLFLSASELAKATGSQEDGQAFPSKTAIYEKLTKVPTGTAFDPLFISTHLQYTYASSHKHFELADRFLKEHLDDRNVYQVLLHLQRHFRATDNHQKASDYFQTLLERDMPDDLSSFIKRRFLAKLD